MPADDGNGRVRNAAAALENSSGAGDGRRSRSRGRDEPEVAAGAAVLPEMVFDVASNTMVTRESLPDDRPVTKSCVMQMLCEFQNGLDKSVEKSTAAALQAFKGEVFQNVSELLQRYDEVAQKKSAAHDLQFEEHRKEIYQQKRDIETLKSDMAKLSETVGLAAKAQPSRKDLAAVGWDAEPDPTFLRINTDKGIAVCKNAVALGIQEWLEDGGLKANEWNLQGDALGRNFSLHFAGEAGTAALRARKLLGTMRIGARKYQNLEAQAPAGRGPIKLYVKANQSEKEWRLERGSKKLFKAIKEELPTRQVGLSRKEGAIMVDWRLVAKVVVHPRDEPPTLQFNQAALTELSLDKSVFTNAFQGIGSTAKINWCI